jgi:hypothetical protein
MASRLPLVLNTGQIQQLQSGDVLSVPIFSGGDVISLTNDNGSPILIGYPVYASAADHVNLAQANAAGTSIVIGLVKDVSIASAAAGNIQVNGVFSASTAQWDAAFGTSGGLVFNTRYYLSQTTAGRGTVTAPSTVGQLVVLLGYALSTTELLLAVSNAILL